jgi:hypothetical protein
VSEDHEWVRRLLAEAGQSPEPMPSEVADRLDRAVAEAAGSTDLTGTEPPAGPVVAMTPRRHRRWAGAVLAAAALTVGGYSLTASGLLDDIGGGSESQSTADGQAEELGPEAPAEGAARADSAEASPGQTGLRDGAAESGAPELTSDTLRRDAARLVASTRDQREAPPAAQLQPGACVPPPTGARGTRLAVTYDDRPATAVLSPRGDGRVDVQVWDCGSPARLARVVVPR